MRLSVLVGVVCALLAASAARAQAVKDLPMPASYVNDFAHVFSPGATQQMEAECRALHAQAHADVAVITLKTLPDDTTQEDFTAALEEKWKLGKKGQDRGLLFLLVVNPPHERIETGYGLEGVLPDAKDGRILDTVVPLWHGAHYDQAAETGLQQIADAITAEAHVTIPPMSTAPAPAYHYQMAPAAQQQGPPQIVVVLGFVVLVGLVYLLYRLGWLGPLFWLLLSMSGNGGGGGFEGGGGDGGGGGFDGSGGGESGGGGASRD